MAAMVVLTNPVTGLNYEIVMRRHDVPEVVKIMDTILRGLPESHFYMSGTMEDGEIKLIPVEVIKNSYISILEFKEENKSE